MRKSLGLMRVDPGNIFEQRFHNQVDDLKRVTETAVRFLEEHGVGARAIYAANLAIEEMGSNILKYGYDHPAVHEILLRLELHPGTVLVVLEDDGHEFNPLEAPPPDIRLPADQRAPGGLGIHLVRKLAAQMNYERCGGRNRLTVEIQS
jgi:anti-sigma regulatory factor (Ser/Thr protein kinase)